MLPSREITPKAETPSGDPQTAKWLAIALFGLVVAGLAVLAAGWWSGQWLVDESGRIIPYDYANLYASGRLVLEGRAAEVYDYALHGAAQTQVLGYDTPGYFPWPYPPHSLLIVAPLAGLPYLASFVAWGVATGAVYAEAARRILGGGIGILAALAFPASLWNVSVGQNGFLSAGLMGLALVLLKPRPVLAGLCFALLTYKPQFGILVPVALAAGGHGRAFATAALGSVALGAASWATLGGETWLAFARSLVVSHDVIVLQGSGNLGKLQTVFGAVRLVGGTVETAFAVQACVTFAAAASVWTTWRRTMAYDAKAAVLVVASLLATPYGFIYDLPILFVAIAFLARTGLDRTERLGIVVAWTMILVASVLPIAVAFLGVAVVSALAMRRSLAGSTTQDAARLPHAQDDACPQGG